MDHIRIKQLRLLLDMRQREYAKELGVSLRTIQNWEHGIHRPSPVASRHLDRLLHLLLSHKEK